MFTYVQILFSNFPYTQCNPYIYIHIHATKITKQRKQTELRLNFPHEANFLLWGNSTDNLIDGTAVHVSQQKQRHK